MRTTPRISANRDRPGGQCSAISANMGCVACAHGRAIGRWSWPPKPKSRTKSARSGQEARGASAVIAMNKFTPLRPPANPEYGQLPAKMG